LKVCACRQNALSSMIIPKPDWQPQTVRSVQVIIFGQLN
jgi:hypothetical protein